MPKDKVIDYQQRADDCALYRATAHNDRAREVWAKMEQYWRKRAASMETPMVPAPSIVPSHEPAR